MPGKTKTIKRSKTIHCASADCKMALYECLMRHFVAKRSNKTSSPCLTCQPVLKNIGEINHFPLMIQLRRFSPKWLDFSDLCKRTQTGHEIVKQWLESLVFSGKVEQSSVVTRGKEYQIFRLRAGA